MEAVPEIREEELSSNMRGDDNEDCESTVSGLSDPTGFAEDEKRGTSPAKVSSKDAKNKTTPPLKEIGQDEQQNLAMDEKRSEILAVNASLTLQEVIEDRQWDQAYKILSRKQQRGVANAADVVAIPFRGYGGDYPLHVVCDWDYLEPQNDDKESEEQQKKRTDKNNKNRAETKTNTKKGADARMAIPPPPELIELILESYPKAARTRGRDGSLPLHYAARGCAPKEILELLIKAFPQALDVHDDFNECPRDFLQQSTQNMAVLDRPTCCWVQHFHDEDERDVVEHEISQLEADVAHLEAEIAKEQTLESNLQAKLEEFEGRISGFNTVPHGRNLEQRAKELEDFFSSEINDIETNLHNMSVTLEHKYDKPHQERKYLKEFDADIELVYREARAEAGKIREELITMQKDIAASAKACE